MINDELLLKILDRDQEAKDAAWAQKMVALIMQNATQLISKKDYEERLQVIRGAFPDVKFDKIFVGDAMTALRNKLTVNNTLYFFERIRSSIIDERTQADLTITVNSLDPEKSDKRRYDRELLKNRKGIENLANEITGNNGMPPQKFSSDDYHGNVDDFDAAGGSEFDPNTLDEFFDRAWGLKDEWAYQNIVNNVFAENEIVSNYDKKMDDILVSLMNCSKVYVDHVDGTIKVKDLRPYELFCLHPTGSNNFKDAQGWTIPMETNVRGFLRMFGTQFTIENDWRLFMNASYSTNSTKITGIYEPVIDPQTGKERDKILRYGETGNLMSFNDFCNLPLAYRYSEFKTITRTTRVPTVTKEGNLINMNVRPFDELADGPDTQVTEKEETYYAYTLDVSALTPKVIKYGKVYMMPFEGANDEYSGFTIKATKRNGVPIAEILKPFYNMINVTFKMLEMLVADIKPDGYQINFSSMVRMAQELVKATDTPTDIKKGIDLFLAMVSNSSNIVIDAPKTQEGMAMGGGTSSVLPNKKGLNDTAVDVMKVIDWAEAKAALYTGTQGLDLANDEGFKVSIERKKRSRAATSFIDFIMLEHLKDCAITVLNYAQDISRFKDIPAYKYLEQAVGWKVMEYIAQKKKSPHRYGAFVQTFNNDIELMEIRQRAAESLAQKEISLENYMVIMSFKNPVQAAMYLSYEKKKAQALQQQQAMTALKGQDALAANRHKEAMELENLKGEWRAKAEDKRAAGFITASQQNSQAQIQTKVIQEQGQNERLANQAINEINKIAADATKNAQAPPKV